VVFRCLITELNSTKKMTYRVCAMTSRVTTLFLPTLVVGRPPEKDNRNLGKKVLLFLRSRIRLKYFKSSYVED